MNKNGDVAGALVESFTLQFSQCPAAVVRLSL